MWDRLPRNEVMQVRFAYLHSKVQVSDELRQVETRMAFPTSVIIRPRGRTAHCSSTFWQMCSIGGHFEQSDRTLGPIMFSSQPPAYMLELLLCRLITHSLRTGGTHSRTLTGHYCSSDCIFHLLHDTVLRRRAFRSRQSFLMCILERLGSAGATAWCSLWHVVILYGSWTTKPVVSWSVLCGFFSGNYQLSNTSTFNAICQCQRG